jgi:carbonic anhydrase
MTSQFHRKDHAEQCNRTASGFESSSVCDRHHRVANEGSSRRKFLQMTVGGAVIGLTTAAGMEFVTPRQTLAQTPLSPDAALQELMDGNKRFTTERLTACEHDLAVLKQRTIEKQEPFAAVLSCADSRVPIELVFDQSIGHIFVTRIAGNIATSEIVASLEYGAGVLGTKVILVMGHGGCGAVKATIQAKEVPGQISALYQRIQPAVDQAGTNLEAVIKANAKIQAALLRQASTVISGLVKDNKLKVAAAYYDIGTGAVSVLK